MRHVTSLFVAATLLAGCADSPTPAQTEGFQAASPIEAGSAEEAAVLALVNDPAVDFALLDDDVGLDRRAAESG